jgi:hypothetical protein
VTPPEVEVVWPPTHEDGCERLVRTVIAAISASIDGHEDEYDVYELPDGEAVQQYHPAFEPLVGRCPHGVTYVIQPTADCRMLWAARGIL